jgi:hypothetical protein
VRRLTRPAPPDALSGFQTCADLLAPLRAFSNSAASALSQRLPGTSRNLLPRALAAVCEVVARAGLSHRTPEFGIDQVEIGGEHLAIRETTVYRTPFCTLLHFAKDGAESQPRILLVAPMSGHFATWLRDTVETLLLDHRIAQNRINKIAPALAAEHAVMADAGLHMVSLHILHMVSLHIGTQIAAQFLGGHRLADGADVVPFAFDSEKRGAPDRLRIDPLAAPFQDTAWQRVILKYRAYGLQVEIHASA